MSVITENDPRLRGWPGGSLWANNGKWTLLLRLRKDRRIVYLKCYSMRKYNAFDAPPPEALEDQMRESDAHGLTRNKCRLLPTGVIEMKLTLGRCMYFLPCSLDQLIQHLWCARSSRHTFYAETSCRLPDGKPSKIRCHRLLLGVETADRSIVVDHRNGNGLDNRLDNLLLTTESGNLQNRCLSSNSQTGVNGVSVNYCRGQFVGLRVSCTKNGQKFRKCFNFSRYPTPQATFDAAVAYRHQIEDELEVASARRMRGADYVEKPVDITSLLNRKRKREDSPSVTGVEDDDEPARSRQRLLDDYF